ncbi:MAG TPA: hypothetical protein VK874_14460 [Gaiellaceae bacterium]|nr:hypothetical protein [Gaiellaceae bacterium]
MRLAAGAVAALLVARLLPEHGVGLWLRLATATLVALLPGLLAARVLRLPAGSAGLAWALAATTAGLALAVLLHTGFWLVVLTMALCAALTLVIGTWYVPGTPTRLDVGGTAVVAGGALLGVALWQVAGAVEGDALFHLGRVRKLAELDSLSLAGLGEFADGGLHPGYAFPVWHAFLAAVAWLADVDPAAVVLHESEVLAPIALLVAYEAGTALFRSRWMGGAVAAAAVAPVALAPGSGGAYRVLELPATASRQLLVPAALTLAFVALREPRRGVLASVAAAALALTLVHPTYSLFLLVPLGGFAGARLLLARRDGRELGLALGAFALPTVAVAAALYPVARTTASYRPDEDVAEGARHGIDRYANQLDVWSDSLYRVAPEVVARTGAVAVAALLLVPLAALASSRRWAAFVLGGSVAVLTLVLVPFVFAPFADLVSLSQARRAAGFVPFAFAFAGGFAVLARWAGVLLPPLALVGGVAAQLLWPGDFAYVLEEGGPTWATWVAAFGGAAALAWAALRRRERRYERPGAIACASAVLFVLPVGVHAAWNWDEREAARPPLPDALVQLLPVRAVVLSDVETSYRLLAQAPLYVVAAPPAHVADTEKNRPYERKATVNRFLRTGDLSIARRAGAGWILVDRRHFDPPLELEPRYRDARYSLFEVDK